jgi:hypothetical protein
MRAFLLVQNRSEMKSNRIFVVPIFGWKQANKQLSITHNVLQTSLDGNCCCYGACAFVLNTLSSMRFETFGSYSYRQVVGQQRLLDQRARHHTIYHKGVTIPKMCSKNVFCGTRVWQSGQLVGTSV